MTHWEYLLIEIDFAKQQEKRPSLDSAGADPSSMGKILNAYGAEGWELVNLRPEFTDAFTGSVKWELQPQTYLAVFKRPRRP